MKKTCISIITYSMLLLFFLTDMETSGKRDSKLEDIADGDTVQKEQFLCPLCPFNGKSLVSLSKHLHNKHAIPAQMQCGKCGKKYQSTGGLHNHIKVAHGNASLFTCEICGKTLFTKYNLKVHMRCHSDERPFSCPLCEARFRHNKDLKRHLHSNSCVENPLSCAVCQKTFTYLTDLIEHSVNCNPTKQVNN